MSDREALQQLIQEIDGKAHEIGTLVGHVDVSREQLLRWAGRLADVLGSPRPEKEEARLGHERLNETRARDVKGDLYTRISWMIDLLSREKADEMSLRLAAEKDLEAVRAEAGASEHRRCAAENRAYTFELQLTASAEVVSQPPQEMYPLVDLSLIRDGIRELVNCRKVKALGCDCRSGGQTALTITERLIELFASAEGSIPSPTKDQ